MIRLRSRPVERPVDTGTFVLNEKTAPPMRAGRSELDGVRAIAIALVLVNHATGWYIGWNIAEPIGLVGVTMFFALSGYLITSRLIAERKETGRVSLRAFYRRRVLRLGPALLVLLATAAVVGTFAMNYEGWRLGIFGAATFTSNWLVAAGNNLGPLGHTWTLAVEEQFYLVWPVVFLLAAARARLVGLGIVVVGLALAPFLGIYATTTNAVAVMVGALLALSGVGSSRVRFLSPLAPMGKRAYGLYLWNWPLTLWLGPLVAVPMTFVMAEASWRAVERPIQRWATSRRAYPARASASEGPDPLAQPQPSP